MEEMAVKNERRDRAVDKLLYFLRLNYTIKFKAGIGGTRRWWCPLFRCNKNKNKYDPFRHSYNEN